MGTNKTMKVGILSASVSRKAGGIYDSLRFLALELNSKPDTEIDLYSLKDISTQVDSSGWLDLPVHVSNTVGPSSFGYAPNLKRVLLSKPLDIIHSNGLWMYPSVVSHQWLKATKKPYLISPHGMLDPWALKNAHWKKRFAGWLYEDAHLREAACLHALCESEADAMRAYGLKNPICIIPNGVHTPSDTFPVLPLWRLQLPPEAKILLFLGRLHPKKGLSQLIEAWSKLNRVPSSSLWHLVIAGWDQGGHEQSLRELAAELNIQDRIHIIGPQFGEQKHACYSHADAFILPSFSEGLPMSVLEAWSYSLPVIMTPQCNLPEGFEAKAALCILPEAEAIAHGLVELFNLPDNKLMDMGSRGKQLTEGRFSWPLIADQMSAVYRWVLKQGPKPDCVVID